MKFVLPEAHHRWCVRHIEANWQKTWKAEEMKKLLWWLAWASYDENFKDQLKDLGNLDEGAASDLMKYPPQSWSRAYFDTTCKNQSVDNNFTESFNAWILEARYKPIIKMLEHIRIKVMNMLREHDEAGASWDSDWSPYSMKLYGQYLRIAHKCTVDFNGDDGFEVFEGNEKHTVKLGERSCTCRTWDLTGIPCPHAIKSLLHLKIEPKTEMNFWYSKEAYALTYQNKIQPVKGQKFWKIEASQAMEPPPKFNKAGRPRVKRTRDKDEAINRQGGWAASRKGRLMTCSKCGLPNHNARGCDKQGKTKMTLKRKRNNRGVQVEATHEPMAAEPEEVNLTAPQFSQSSSQGSSFVFMPTPSINNSSTVNAADLENPQVDEDPALRPRTVPEMSRMQSRHQEHNRQAPRAISFTGDRQTGVVVPTNLPYSARSLTWMGREAVTGNNLELQRQTRIGKLKPWKGK